MFYLVTSVSISGRKKKNGSGCRSCRLCEVRGFFDRQGIKYLVIGRIANAVWGRPRATLDADFKILPGNRSITDLVDLIYDNLVSVFDLAVYVFSERICQSQSIIQDRRRLFDSRFVSL